MFNVISHQGTVNQNSLTITTHYQNGQNKDSINSKRARKDVKKLDPLYIVSGNKIVQPFSKIFVRCGFFGLFCFFFPPIWNYHTTQHLHFWALVLEKLKFMFTQEPAHEMFVVPVFVMGQHCNQHISFNLWLVKQTGRSTSWNIFQQ